MAVSSSTAAPARGQPPGQSRGGFPRSPVTWLIVLGIALAAGAYLLYRSKTSSAASGTSTDTQDTPSGTENPDWSGEIATLQTEIMDLQSSEAQGSGGSSSSTQVEVPDVVDLALVDAQRDIGYAGLKSTASGPKTTKAGETRVVTGQSPAAGAKVDKGTNVALTYKIGNPPAAKKPAATAKKSTAAPAASTAKPATTAAAKPATTAAAKPVTTAAKPTAAKPAAKPAAKVSAAHTTKKAA